MQINAIHGYTKLNTCKHKGFRDYQWEYDKLGRSTDRLIAIYCHNCGEQIKKWITVIIAVQSC